MAKSLSKSRSLVAASLLMALGASAPVFSIENIEPAYVAGPSVVVVGQEIVYQGGKFAPGTTVVALATDARGGQARISIPVRDDGGISPGFQAGVAGPHSIAILDARGNLLASHGVMVVEAGK